MGTPDLDHRIADLLPAGRSDRRVDLQNLERPGTGRLLARTLHQHLARHGYRFGHPAVGGDRLHLRHAGHVRLAHDLFVPLHGAFPPLRIALVRGLADGDRLFRRLQGSQIHTRGPCLHPADRQPPALGHRHLLGGLLAAAVLHPAFQSQHPAHHDPFGNLRAGPRLRGQRPGELHRRARGRVRRLHHRPGSGRHADAHGRAERECPGQFPDPADGGHPDDPHAVDFEEGHARLRNRAFALGAGRRRPAAVRLVGLLADDRPRGPQRQRRHRARGPETPPGEHFAPFRIRGRGTQRRALRHDPRHGQPDHFGAADRHGHLTQTPAVDHLRLLHGGDGFVARRPRVGTRKRRVPHFGRYDRRGRMVHHRAGRIPDRLRGGAGADLRRDPGLHRHHAVVRVHAHPQQLPEKGQGERHRQGA